MIHIQAAPVGKPATVTIDPVGFVFTARRGTYLSSLETIRVRRWDPQNKTKKGKVKSLRLQYWRIPTPLDDDALDVPPWWNTAKQFHNHNYNRLRGNYRHLLRSHFRGPR
jgi:hypothetical protein